MVDFVWWKWLFRSSSQCVIPLKLVRFFRMVLILLVNRGHHHKKSNRKMLINGLAPIRRGSIISPLWEINKPQVGKGLHKLRPNFKDYATGFSLCA